MTLTETSTDAELVDRAAAGDRAAFTTLYRRHIDTVHDHVARWCRDGALASDATQEAFVALLDRLDTIRDGQAVLAWLLRTARNRAIDQLRRTGRERTTTPLDDGGIPSAVLTAVDEDRAGSPERAAEANDAAGWLWDVASGLDERTFTVLDLTVRHGLTGPELAAVLDTTPANANVLTHRMRNRVRTLFGGVAFLRAGGETCARLQAIEESLADPLDLPGARRLEAHADDCRACADRRRRAVAPLRAYAAFAEVRAPDTVRAGVEEAIDRHFDSPGTPGDGGAGGLAWSAAVARAAVIVVTTVGLASVATPMDEPAARFVTGVAVDGPSESDEDATDESDQSDEGETVAPQTSAEPSDPPRTTPPGTPPVTAPDLPTQVPTTPSATAPDATQPDQTTPGATPTDPGPTTPRPRDPGPTDGGSADAREPAAEPGTREPPGTPLVVGITTPANGTRIGTTPGRSVTLSLAAAVTGADPATTTVAWRSDQLSGIVLRTSSGSVTVPGRRDCDPTIHRLTVLATASDGRTATDDVVVELVPSCPTLSVRITTPADGTVVPTDDVEDPTAPAATVVATGEATGGTGEVRFVWHSDQVASPLLSGRSGRIRLTAAGCRVATTHVVTLTATDPASGASARASVGVTVRPTC